MWELRKNLKEQNSPQAQEENKKVEDFIVNKVTTLVNGGVFNPNDEQAPALKELLADIENNPVSVETAEKKETLAQAIGIVNEQIADFEERHNLQQDEFNDELIEHNLQILEGMPADDVLFKRGDDGKLVNSEFEEIDNILNHLKVRGELTWFGRKTVEQTAPDSDIALFKERIRLETQAALALGKAEEITEEAFREEYVARLNQGIFEVVYANAIVEGKVDRKDMNKLVSDLSKSAQKGTLISVHQDVFAGWQAAHQAEGNSFIKILKDRGVQKTVKSLGDKFTSLSKKCQKKYPQAYGRLLGLLEGGGWGLAYGVATNPAVMTATGGASLAIVATASLARSGYRFYKNYRKARDEAVGKGKRLGFWKYVQENKMQSAGVLLSATAALTAGLDWAGVFAGNSELLAGITQARMVSGLSLWGTTSAKQVGDAYRKGGWKAAAKATGLSLLNFGVGFIGGRAASSAASNLYDSYVNNSIDNVVEHTGADIQNSGTEDVSVAEAEIVQNSETVAPLENQGQENVVAVKVQTELNHVNDGGLSQHNTPAAGVQSRDEVGVSVNAQETINDVADDMSRPDMSVLDIDIEEQLPEVSQEMINDITDDMPRPDMSVLDLDVEEQLSEVSQEMINDITDDMPRPDMSVLDLDVEEQLPEVSQETTNNITDDMPRPEEVEQVVDIEEKPEPLFMPEGKNEDGSLYGTTAGGRQVSDFSIDEDGKVLSMTVDGEEFGEDHLRWINEHPGIKDGWESRALATAAFADEILNQKTPDMAENLTGEWQEYEVQAPEAREMPGTPMTADSAEETVVSGIAADESVKTPEERSTVDQPTQSPNLMERIVDEYHEDLQNNHGLVGETHDVSNNSSSWTRGGEQTVSLKIASVADNGLAQVSSDGAESFTISEDGQLHFRTGEGENVRDMTYDEAKTFVDDMYNRIPKIEGSQTDMLLHKGLYELNPKQFTADYPEGISEFLHDYSPPEGYNVAQDLKLEGHTETPVGKGDVEIASGSYDVKGHIAALREKMPQASSPENGSIARNVSSSSMNVGGVEMFRSGNF